MSLSEAGRTGQFSFDTQCLLICMFIYLFLNCRYDYYTNPRQTISHEYYELTYPKPTDGHNWWVNTPSSHIANLRQKKDLAPKLIQGLFGIPDGIEVLPDAFTNGDRRSLKDYNRIARTISLLSYRNRHHVFICFALYLRFFSRKWNEIRQ